jgi:mannose-6-phosphate isomerase-like protein (cupin superfamily)
MTFETRRISPTPDATAPDGSEVRLLCRLARGSLAHFTLPPGAVSIAVAHRTIEEVWYVLTGRGRMWRRLDGREEVVELSPGLSLTLPVGTWFQFRCDGAASLAAVGVAMPPWPGEDETYPVEGPWQATV